VHFNALIRGVFDLRDLLYPVSVIIAFLWINARLLDWRGSR